MKKIKIEYKSQTVSTFSTPNKEIKAACTPVNEDTMKIEAYHLLVFRASSNTSKEAKKETYMAYYRAKNKIIKIWQSEKK